MKNDIESPKRSKVVKKPPRQAGLRKNGSSATLRKETQSAHMGGMKGGRRSKQNTPRSKKGCGNTGTNQTPAQEKCHLPRRANSPGNPRQILRERPGNRPRGTVGRAKSKKKHQPNEMEEKPTSTSIHSLHNRR